MCVVALALAADPRWPLVVVGNRDEFHARPAAPLALAALLLSTSQGEFPIGEATSLVVDTADVLLQADAGTAGQHRQSECR